MSKVQIIKTGEIADIEGVNPGILWMFERSGAIKILPVDKPKKGTNYVLKQEKAEAPNGPSATWWLDGEGKDTAIHARCSDCKLHEIILDSGKAKFEHCGRTEFAPEVVVAQYKKARSIFR